MFVRFLTPHSEKLIVAGSLRRRKAIVQDIEILFVPKMVSEIDETHLFKATHQVPATDKAIETLLELALIVKRPNSKGSFTWGDKNKLAVHGETGIAVDLFTATRSNWFNYLVCRTGGADNNVAICNAAIARGWKWNPYGDGFSRPRGLSSLKGEVHPVGSEREVFDFVGLEYLEPWERK